MAVVRKGESTPWSTDHANWIFANRFFFFARKAAARDVNLYLRIDAIGRFQMVKKNNESNWEATPARWDDGEPAESEFEQLMEHHLRDVKQRLCA